MAISFLASLAGGMFAALTACRIQQVAWKFVRLVGIVAFVLAGIILLVSTRAVRGPGGDANRWGLGLTIGTALLAFGLMVIAPLVERYPRAVRGICAMGGALGLAAACAWSMGPEGMLRGGQTGKELAILGGRLSGGLLLGTVTVAWMLGHAYLTATRMTIAPLRMISRLLAAAVALRVAYVGASLAVLWTAGDSGAVLSRIWTASWPALSLRVGGGLVLLSVFAYMVLDCVRLRSTQSATGILYFASLLAYVGELSSQHLVATWGWPL